MPKSNDFNNWTSFDSWKNACSQQSGCLSCPLSIKNTGKECYGLTAEEITMILAKEVAKDK